VSGRAAAAHWASLPGTRVYGLSRRSATLPAGVEAISADLLDRDDLQRKLGTLSGITHIVSGAYIERATAAERSETNLAILQNLLDAVEPASPSLRHVTFYQGGKAYGADLAPSRRPPVRRTRGSCRRTSITTSCSPFRPERSRTKPISHKFVFKDFFSAFVRCF
jgi:nucleoside-diphosphate-sugar epimerase